MSLSPNSLVAYDPKFIDEEIEIPFPTFDTSLAGKVFTNTNNELRDGKTFDQTGQWRNYIHFSVATNTELRQPICAASNLQQSEGTGDRRPPWKIDEAIGREFQLNDNYFRGGDTEGVYDRGHIPHRGGIDWGNNDADKNAASDSTFYFTNCCLQHENHNRDEWVNIENGVLEESNKISAFTGPIFDHPGIPQQKTLVPRRSNNGPPTGEPEAIIPDGFFKVYVFKDSNGNLVTRANISLQSEEAIKTRSNNVSYGNNEDDLVPLEEVEFFTGLKFDKKLHESSLEQNRIYTKKRSENNLAPRLPGTQPPNQIFIYAARINPPGGTDVTDELVSIGNLSNSTIDLTDWTLTDQTRTDTPFILSGTVPVLEARSYRTRDNGGRVQLRNSGGELTLKDADGNVIDYVKWERQPDGVDAFFVKF